MTERPSLPIEVFPEALRRHVDPGSPVPLRMMGARGMVPAPPNQFVLLLYQLALDADATVASSARKTAADAPQQVVLAAVAGPCPAPVLDFLAEARVGQENVLEAILNNRLTPDTTVVRLAKAASEHLTEIIAQNEVRLLRTPAIIEALYLNERSRMSTLDRLIDLARRNDVSFHGLPALQALLEEKRYDTALAAEKADAVVDERLGQYLVGSVEEAEREQAELQGLSEMQKTEKRLRDNEALEQEVETKKKTGNRQSQLANMSISERVRVATLGSAKDRDYLIREQNKLIHMAAVTSPKVQFNDIVAWSNNRSLPDGVIKYIAANREYRRSYQIVVNLVNNPKTPLQDSIKFLQSLLVNDLKAVAKNRNISAQVRRMAKIALETKEKGRR